MVVVVEKGLGRLELGSRHRLKRGGRGGKEGRRERDGFVWSGESSRLLWGV
jgi:hypothetical protein